MARGPNASTLNSPTNQITRPLREWSM